MKAYLNSTGRMDSLILWNGDLGSASPVPLRILIRSFLIEEGFLAQHNSNKDHFRPRFGPCERPSGDEFNKADAPNLDCVVQ